MAEEALDRNRAMRSARDRSARHPAGSACRPAGLAPVGSRVFGRPSNARRDLSSSPLGMPYAQYKAWWWGLGELPDYTVTSWDNGFLFAPKDRYYHGNSAPQVRWWLADGL